MPIYSKNRSGSMALEGAKLSKNYGMNDTGLALYESCVNTHTIFDAMINYDMSEIKGLKEGTILESEIVSLNEASISGIITKIIEGFQKLKAKLVRIFRDAMDKITEFLMGDCSKTLKEYEDIKKDNNLNAAKNTATVNAKVPTSGFKFELNASRLNNIFQTTVEEYDEDGEYTTTSTYKNKADEGFDRNSVINTELGAIFNTKSLTPDEFHKKFETEGFTSKAVKFNDAEAEKAVGYIKNYKETVKAIKKHQEITEGVLNSYIEYMKKLNHTMSRKERTAANIDTSSMNSMASAVQTVINTYVSAAIRYNRSKAIESRKLLGGLIAKVKGFNDTAVHVAVEAVIDADFAFSEFSVVSDEAKRVVDEVCNEIA